MPDRLEVISSTLLLAFVRVERGVPGGASQILAVAVRNVLPVGRFVVLGESEVDYVEVVFRVLLPADQEVIGLDVAVYDSFFMTLLNPLYHHESDHATSLQVKLMAAGLEQVLQTLAQQLHDHYVKLIIRYRLVSPDVEELRDERYRAVNTYRSEIRKSKSKLNEWR